MENSQDNYNKSGFIAFLFSIIFCLAFFVYIAFIHPGVDLNELDKQAAERADQVLGDAADTSPAFDIASVEKPWVPNEDVAAYGAKVYKTNCAICHGDSGAGDGVAGKGLVPPPRNLIEGGWKKGGTSIKLFETLRDGIPGGSMASFKHLPKADRWAMVQFIRSITKDKPADDAAKLEAFAQKAE